MWRGCLNQPEVRRRQSSRVISISVTVRPETVFPETTPTRRLCRPPRCHETDTPPSGMRSIRAISIWLSSESTWLMISSLISPLGSAASLPGSFSVGSSGDQNHPTSVLRTGVALCHRGTALLIRLRRQALRKFLRNGEKPGLSRSVGATRRQVCGGTALSRFDTSGRRVLRASPKHEEVVARVSGRAASPGTSPRSPAARTPRSTPGRGLPAA